MVEAWFSGHAVVADLSWGLVDTTVLHLRTQVGAVIVKAGGPEDAHIGREITGHERWTSPWLPTGHVGDLVHADREHNLLAVTYLPGSLVDGTPSATDPEVHRQAGELLAAFHRQDRRVSQTYEAEQDARSLQWLDGDHRIPAPVEAQLREVIATHEHPPAVLVPTHGDWQPRNWLIDDGTVRIIDLGRADWRPAVTDLARLARQQWDGRPDLEAAFVRGYGSDPRDRLSWQRTLVREAVSTACWAHVVGAESFEHHGHTLIERVLATAT